MRRVEIRTETTEINFGFCACATLRSARAVNPPVSNARYVLTHAASLLKS